MVISSLWNVLRSHICLFVYRLCLHMLDTRLIPYGPQTSAYKDEVESRSGDPTNEKGHLELHPAQSAHGTYHETSHVEL